MPLNLPIAGTSLTPQQLAGRATEGVSGIYVHVPFCVTKCAYCDFYSLPGESFEQMQQYVRALLKEANWWASHLGPIKTIFFGGGTPTLLPDLLMRELVQGLRDRFDLAPHLEWTTEANPATLSRAYCDMLLSKGINRLSIGAQSFIDSELAAIHRIHDAQAISQTVEIARAAGFTNLSLDLMYALPGQTQSTWSQTLEAAVSLGVPHISAYCLTLEQNTPMWRALKSGKLAQPDEQTQRDFMRRTRQFLGSAGLIPYEISNFARPGYECRHNLMYWGSGNYVGLGPAAASHIGSRRWRNSPSLSEYLKAILDADCLPICDDETLTPQQQALELIMLGLRTREGISIPRLTHLTDAKISDFSSLAWLSRLGLLYTGPSAIHLTDEGTLVADHVISEVVRELD